MAGNAAKRFRAVLEPLQGGLGWVVAWIPFDVEAAWKKMVRLRVKVEVGGQLRQLTKTPLTQGTQIRVGNAPHSILLNSAGTTAYTENDAATAIATVFAAIVPWLILGACALLLLQPVVVVVAPASAAPASVSRMQYAAE